MSNPNTQGKKSRSNSSVLSIEELKGRQVPQTAFCYTGEDPISCTYFIPTNILRERVLQLAQSYCKDFYRCDVNTVEGQDEPEIWVWIHSDSDDLINKDLINNPNAFIHRPTARYSDSMKKFMALFVEKDKRHVEKAKQDHFTVGLPVDLFSYLYEAYDGTGDGYREVYSADGRFVRTQSCKIAPRAIYDSDGRLAGIEVTKSRDAKIFDKRLTPRRSRKL